MAELSVTWSVHTESGPDQIMTTTEETASSAANAQFDRLLLCLGPSRYSRFPSAAIAGTIYNDFDGHSEDPSVKSYGVKRSQERLLCLAQGPESDNWVLLLTNASGLRIVHGAGLPKELQEWLLDIQKVYKDESDQQLQDIKIALGPNESFVAWSHEYSRWDNVCPWLDKYLQILNSPKGRRESGNLRQITLGSHENWYYMTDKKRAWNLSNECASLAKLLKESPEMHENIKYVCLNPSTPDEHIIVFRSRQIKGKCSKDNYDCIDSVVEKTYPTAIREARERARQEGYERGKVEAEQQAKKQKAQAQSRKRAAEAEEESNKRQRRGNSALGNKTHAISLAWQAWREATLDMARSTRITTFPSPSTRLCKCSRESCMKVKSESSLQICYHEVDSLLRTSEDYSLGFLKAERTQWHPDRILGRCDPLFKDGLMRQSTEMFQIFQELIEKELEKNKC